ncbi:MAG: hypothetical protein LC751_10800 [Actinobacteria bacterium]|nr:hypothetical protein [Actinomycetota bacterium]
MDTLFYGLAADPVHQTHIDITVDAVRGLSNRGRGISNVVLGPTYQRNPIGKKTKVRLRDTYEHRYAMCELAAREIESRLVNCAVRASRLAKELAQRTGSPNYEFETLSVLREQQSAGRRIVSLMGSDLMSGEEPEFQRWYRFEDLSRLVVIALVLRPGFPPNESFLESLERIGAEICRLPEIPLRETSSTLIRARLDAGEDPMLLANEGLLPKTVAAYLAAERI